MKKVYIYHKFERFWHWMQAILILFLAFTGFEIHGTYSFFGYENAVIYHRIAAWAFIVLIVFAIFWHLTTGEIKQYMPTMKNLKAQINYYLLGIFKNAPHPTKKTVLSKLNPLQRLTYLGLKVVIFPILVFSGVLYMYYRYPMRDTVQSLDVSNLTWIAYLHTAGALLLVVFLIVHLYLITTGETITSNLKAMITGYEDIEDDEEEQDKKSITESDNNVE